VISYNRKDERAGDAVDKAQYDPDQLHLNLYYSRSQEWSQAYDKWVNEYLQLVPRRYR
jgi:hypothetical protein